MDGGRQLQCYLNRDREQIPEKRPTLYFCYTTEIIMQLCFSNARNFLYCNKNIIFFYIFIIMYLMLKYCYLHTNQDHSI